MHSDPANTYKHLSPRIIITGLSPANAITYKGFCSLGGLLNPRLSQQHHYLGKHYHHTTYHMFDLTQPH